MIMKNGAVARDQLIHTQGRAQNREPCIFGKPGGRDIGRAPCRTAGVVVERKTVHEEVATATAGALHQYLSPVIIIHIRTTGDLVDLVFAKVTYVGLKAAILVGIIFGSHRAAAAPIFVADPPIFDAPCRSSWPLLPAQISHRTHPIKGDVFNPLLHLLYRTAADIAADIRFTAQLVAQLKKVVGAKGVVFGDATPMGVDHRRARGFITDTVHPMIFVSETAAGPAQVGNVEIA